MRLMKPTNILKNKLLFFYNSFRFTEKLQRQYRKFPNIQNPISPSISILHYYGMFVIINEPILIHYLLGTLFRFL